MNSPNSRSPIITGRISKFIGLRKQFQTDGGKLLAFLDDSTKKIRSLVLKTSTLPNSCRQKHILRKLLFLFTEYRPEIASYITNVIGEIDVWCNIFRQNNKYTFNNTALKLSPTFQGILNLLNSKEILVPTVQPKVSFLLYLLRNVPYDYESKTGLFIPEIQDLFETAFIYRDIQLRDSLSGLASAIKTSISFGNLEGFIRAMGSKLINDYQLNECIPQLVLCIQRLVYPYVYTLRPDFFPFKKMSVYNTALARETPTEKMSFKAGLEILNTIMFYHNPNDMIFVLLTSGGYFVDSFMMIHNLGVGIDFVA